MRTNLNNLWYRVLFLGLVTLLSATLVSMSGEACLAAHWNASSDPALWLKAARLEPDNAAYWARLGSSRQWALSPGNPQEATRYLEKATQVNPRSADSWMELADTYQMSADAGRAEEAYAKAQQSYPISAEVAWRYGSFLIYRGVPNEAAVQFHRALTVDPSLTTAVLSECQLSGMDVAAILDNVLPSRRNEYVDAINFFLSQKMIGAALMVWNHGEKLRLPIKIGEAVPLIDSLIANNDLEDAEKVWNAGLRITGWDGDSASKTSLISNGSFERDSANGGFDWREIEVEGAHFDFDEFSAHSGSRSLRIRFDGTTNLDFQNLLQFVPVEPGNRYHFSAHMKSERLSTDRGVHFEIVDAKHPAEFQVATADLTGTNPWIPVECDFVSGPETRLLRISLRRIPSWKFDNQLSGTVWIDDVMLTPVAVVPSKGTSQ